MLPALAGDLAGGSGDRRAGAQMRPGGFGTQPPGVVPGRAAAHQRRHPHPDDLAAAYKQLAAVGRGWRDMKGRAAAPPRLPLPRRPHPRPRPAVLAGTAAHPRHRERHRRHLAQHPPPARPDPPGHPGHPRRPGRPARGHQPGQQAILSALKLREPPRFFDFATQAGAVLKTTNPADCATPSGPRLADRPRGAAGGETASPMPQEILQACSGTGWAAPTQSAHRPHPPQGGRRKIASPGWKPRSASSRLRGLTCASRPGPSSTSGRGALRTWRSRCTWGDGGQ